jgi:hypothetical protein
MAIPKFIKIIGAISISVLLMIIVWFTAIGGTAYFYAGYLEEKWINANPKTKDDLEQYLSLYSLHQIEPKKSMWCKKVSAQKRGKDDAISYTLA